MPLLPSGKNFYISSLMILEPEPNFFRCPEGHFWYRTPDLAINKPPFPSGSQIITDFAHAPVPKDREEVKQYVQVLIGLDRDRYYWRGDMLSGFPQDGELDEADLAAWNEWLASDSTQEFLDETIEKCRAQAEANRHNVGYLTVRAQPVEDRVDPDEIRLRQIGRRAGALEIAADRARAADDVERAREIFSELEALLDETSTIRRRRGRRGGVDVYVEGYLNRVLRRWATAEACFREYLQSVPFHVEAWLELTWCLSEQDDLEEAEVAARRAAKLAPENAGAWGNLAMVLIRLGERVEARETLDRALAIDPDDRKNRYVDAHFDEYFKHPAPSAPHEGGAAADSAN